MSSVKMGQKRTEPTLYHSIQREPMRSISPKHKQELREYNKIRNKLLELSGGKSEISGLEASNSSIEDMLDPHHITGRNTYAKLVNPFNIVICLSREHWVCQDAMSWENKLELLEFVKPIRLAQGFKLEDYPAL